MVFSLLLAVQHPLYSSASTAPVVVAPRPIVQSTQQAGVPVRLTVPVAGIDAPIDAVGTTASGDMKAPDGPFRTSWYQQGPHPGSIGSAVIAGHYGLWKNGDVSVFENLSTLKKGDKVYVKDDKGATFTFTVQGSRILGRNDDAKSVFTSTDNKSHLNLITCYGTWQNSQKTYSNRLVVFTDL